MAESSRAGFLQQPARPASEHLALLNMLDDAAGNPAAAGPAELAGDLETYVEIALFSDYPHFRELSGPDCRFEPSSVPVPPKSLLGHFPVDPRQSEAQKGP